MSDREVRVRGDIYCVHLSADGDHIVVKRNKRDPEHAYSVDAESRTWERAVKAAQENGNV